MLVIVFFILLGFLSITLVMLFIYSPGNIKPYTDDRGVMLPGTVSEKIFVKIGGVEQGMFIRSKNINNPVLLYIHGGPAFPNYFLIDKYEPGLEDHFTVCYWEQRGGGLSYNSEVTLESMNFDRFTDDAIEVTNYLRGRFGKEKIYLMAHSGGTPFAIMAAAKAPELFYAYIGMAQITNQAESEKLAYKYMLEQYNLTGDDNAVEEFKKYPVLDSADCIIKFYKSALRDNSMHELGIGTMRNMKSVFTGVFLPVWMCRAYTLREKVNIWFSKFSFMKKTKMTEELFRTDFPTEVPKLEIPVYFFSGKYDLTVNHDLSKSYLNKLQAPVKGFYTFDNSAHSPLFEEPGKTKEILVKDVLMNQNGLADKE